MNTMGFTINEEITTKLHYKDIALIAVAMGIYQDKFKDNADKDVLDRMKRLVNRLGEEMYDYQNIKPDVSGNEALREAVSFADWIHLHSYSKTTQGWIWARGEYPFPIKPNDIKKYSTNELYEKFKSETAKATDR